MFWGHVTTQNCSQSALSDRKSIAKSPKFSRLRRAIIEWFIRTECICNRNSLCFVISTMIQASFIPAKNWWLTLQETHQNIWISVFCNDTDAFYHCGKSVECIIRIWFEMYCVSLNTLLQKRSETLKNTVFHGKTRRRRRKNRVKIGYFSEFLCHITPPLVIDRSESPAGEILAQESLLFRYFVVLFMCFRVFWG